MIHITICANLEAWGLRKHGTVSSYIDKGGRCIEYISIEQQYKGNYLLLATIDGKNRKYIIRKGTPEHDALMKMGLMNVTQETMRELVNRFLVTD